MIYVVDIDSIGVEIFSVSVSVEFGYMIYLIFVFIIDVVGNVILGLIVESVSGYIYLIDL